MQTRKQSFVFVVLYSKITPVLILAICYGTGTSIVYHTCCGERITQLCCGTFDPFPMVLFCIELINNIFLYLASTSSLILFVGVELCWNIYPSNSLSSASLLCLHLIILWGLWSAPPEYPYEQSKPSSGKNK